MILYIPCAFCYKNMQVILFFRADILEIDVTFAIIPILHILCFLCFFFFCSTYLTYLCVASTKFWSFSFSKHRNSSNMLLVSFAISLFHRADSITKQISQISLDFNFNEYIFKGTWKVVGGRQFMMCVTSAPVLIKLIPIHCSLMSYSFKKKCSCWTWTLFIVLIIYDPVFIW